MQNETGSMSEADRTELMDRLRGQVPAPAISITYRIALLLVMFAMLLLPVVYLLLIAAAGWGVVWYATHAAGMLTVVRGGRAMIVVLILYLAPIVAGGLLVLFMFRPLFARRARPEVSITLQRQQEPVLFEFVDRSALLVGAPTPKRICVDYDVNASASFGGGWLSMLGNDLTLTIGVPLAANLTVAEFAGVLAHEFGHFSQGAGMRVSYVIRTINVWLARQVYDRDTWDEWVQSLVQSDTHWSVNLVGLLAALMVGASRLVLRALMVIGAALSSLLLRQMEYDADRYQVNTVGTLAFAQSYEKIALAAASSSAALSTLQQSWSRRKLCDDLCALIETIQQSMPREVGDIIRKQLREERTRTFDSHPSAKDRIKAAKRAALEGFFQDERSASILFANFPAISRMVTLDLYQQALGDSFDPSHLVPTRAYLAPANTR